MIDFKKFKKVSSDKHTTTLKHDDGHEFKVVHSALSPKLRKDIQKIPMADGGTVGHLTISEESKPTSKDYSYPSHPTRPEDQERVNQSKENAKNIWQPKVQSADEQYSRGGKIPHYAEGTGDVREMVDNQIVSQQPEYGLSLEQNPTGMAQGNDHGMFGAPGDSASSADPLQNYVQQQGQSQKSMSMPQPFQSDVTGGGGPGIVPQPGQSPAANKIDQMLQPDPRMAQQVQKAAQQNIDQNQHIAQQFQMKKSQLDAEHGSLVHDIMNKHIDMSDYWKANDKGAAALGALLGGMGSGLTHLANPVPGMIANSQENFLKAEMANMDNPKSLLSAVQAQYGDNKDSADIMRIISNEALSSQIQKVMAPLNSANAQANAAKVQMELMQNSEQLKQQIAMRQALTSGGANMDPSMAVRALVPEAHQKEVFKEIADAQNAKRAGGDLMSMFDQMDKENTVVGRASHLGATPASVSNFEANVLPLIRDKEGRVNEFELDTLRSLEPKPGDTAAKVREKKIGLQKLIQTKQSAPTAKGYGIDLEKFASTAPNSSVQTATMGGKLYRKVPGGWAPAQ